MVLSASEPMAYVGRAPCGCIRMAVVDDPQHKQRTAREIAKAIKAGETVERVTCEYVRTTSWRCDAHPNEKAFRADAKKSKQEGLLL
jgi:hypothetical protein